MQSHKISVAAGLGRQDPKNGISALSRHRSTATKGSIVIHLTEEPSDVPRFMF